MFVFLFAFVLNSVELIVIYSQTNLNLFINSYSSCLWLISYWSSYLVAKFKMANEIKRSLL